MKNLKLFYFTALAIVSVGLLAFTLESPVNSNESSGDYLMEIDDQDDYSNCVTKVDSEWGGSCLKYGFSDSKYTVHLSNSCSEVVDLMCAVQRENNRWRVFYRMDMRQGDTLSAYDCQGNGKYLKWVRKAGDITVKFPTIQQVNDQY